MRLAFSCQEEQIMDVSENAANSGSGKLGPAAGDDDGSPRGQRTTDLTGGLRTGVVMNVSGGARRAGPFVRSLLAASRGTPSVSS